MAKLASKSKTREVVNKHNFRFKKSLGQNFLIDQNVIDKIISASQIGKDDFVVEIGPGIGTLTKELAYQAKHVLAVEIDSNLIPILQETLVDNSNISIINDDVLKVDIDQVVAERTNGEFGKGGKPYKVIANLPYYITTPIIMALLEGKCNIESIVIMIQKEVADRIKAKPGGKEYGALSVAVQFYTEPEMVVKVPGGAFMPPPDVDSAVIKLKVRSEPIVKVNNSQLFFRIVKAAFNQRRKTILNALSNGHFSVDKEAWLQILSQSNIDSKRRGETFSLQEFASITNLLDEIMK